MSTTSHRATEAASAPPRGRAATRERLLDAGRSLLVREGLRGVSVERLCDEAGYTRGAFYSNFTSMDDLVEALVRRELDAVLDTIKEAAAPSSIAGLAPEQAAAVVLERFALLQPPDLEWFLLHLELEIRGLRGDVGGDVFVGWWHAVIDGVADVVTTVLGGIGLRLTIDPHDAAVILMGIWDSMVLRSLVDERPLDTGMLRTTLPQMLLSLTEPV